MVKRVLHNLKSVCILGALACTTFYNIANAQSPDEAYMLSKQFQNGSARSSAMGQAGVALGGDLGFISLNPASSAVYKFYELSFTPALSINSNKTDYLGNTSSGAKTRFGIPSFGFVTAHNKDREYGLKNWNFSIAFNRVNDFNNIMTAKGRTAKSSYLGSMAWYLDGINAKDLDITESYNPYNNGEVTWPEILAWNTCLIDTLAGTSGKRYIGATENLIGKDIAIGGDLDQSYRSISKGNVSEFAFNFGANISDKFFFGFNLGVQSIYYSTSSAYSEYAVNSRHFESGFNHFRHTFNKTTTGSGINLKAGIIYTPIPSIRFGASISTPTWMSLHDEWYHGMESKLDATGTKDNYYRELESNLGVYNYNLRTPFRWNVGTAYLFGKFGTVSIDYERVVYSQMKYSDNDYDDYFKTENSSIKSGYKASNIVRIGSEVRFTPYSALRLGFQYYSSGDRNFKQDRYIGSAGIGYNSPNGFFADLAYMQDLDSEKSSYSFYKDADGIVAPIADAKWNNFKVLLTVGLRF